MSRYNHIEMHDMQGGFRPTVKPSYSFFAPSRETSPLSVLSVKSVLSVQHGARQ
jgi:hypothetical protein